MNGEAMSTLSEVLNFLARHMRKDFLNGCS